MSDEIENQAPVEAPAGPQEVVVVEPHKPSIDETMDRVWQEIQDRDAPAARGPDGKFQAKVVAPPGAPAAPELPGQSQAAPPDPASQVIEAPQSWPADVKAKWATLPPDIQRYVADREGEVHKKFSTDGERLQTLAAIEQATAPYQARFDELQQAGVPRADYFRNLMSFDVGLKTDPVNAVRALEQYTGLNFAQLSRYSGQPGAPQGQPQAPPDPHTSALTRHLYDLSSKVQMLQKQNEDSLIAMAEQKINEFKADKPHFDSVVELMNKLITGGVATGLQDAYEQAVKLHPDVSAKIKAEADEAARKKAEEEAKARAAKDSRAAPFARRPGSTPTTPVKGKSIWETMDRVGKEISARE